MYTLYSVYNNMLFHFEGLKSGTGKGIGGKRKGVSELIFTVKGINFPLIA